MPATMLVRQEEHRTDQCFYTCTASECAHRYLLKAVTGLWGLSLPQMHDCHFHQPLCWLQSVRQYWSHALTDTSFPGTGDGPFSQAVPRAGWSLGAAWSRRKLHAPSHKVLGSKSGALVLSLALCASAFPTTKREPAHVHFSVRNTQHSHTCVCNFAHNWIDF